MNFFNKYADGEIKVNEEGNVINNESKQENSFTNEFLSSENKNASFADQFVKNNNMKQYESKEGWAEDFQNDREREFWVDDFHKGMGSLFF
jgi:hypothetical protein